MSFRCRNGHESARPDRCSLCGVPIEIETPPPPPRRAARPITGPNTCPFCGEVRLDPDVRYCEVCRFDFFGHEPGAAPGRFGAPPNPYRPEPRRPEDLADEPAEAPPAADTPAEATPLAARGVGRPAEERPRAAVSPEQAACRVWEAIVSVDPNLDVAPDAGLRPPLDQPVQVHRLRHAQILIGRDENRRDTQPDIPLRDPGVSRRHARLLLDGGGRLSVVDMVSTNGTYLNGRILGAGMVQPITPGDTLTLGRWTRITLRGQL